MSNLNVPTLHIQTSEGETAETIFLLGNLFRAKCITDNFLEDVEQSNTTRNIFGYMGTYKGRRVSVMGTDIGCPSISIYSRELIHFYECENPIRMGTAGALSKKLKVRNMVFTVGACTTSNYVCLFGLPGDYSCITSYELLSKAVEEAEVKGLTYHVGNMLSSGMFYGPAKSITDGMTWSGVGILAVEMGATVLYSNTTTAGTNASCAVIISNSVVIGEAATAKERQTTFTNMMEIVLPLA